MNIIFNICLFLLFTIQYTTCIVVHEEITVNNSFAVCYNLAHLNHNIKTPQYHNTTASFFAKYQKPEYFHHCHAKSITFF